MESLAQLGFPEEKPLHDSMGIAHCQGIDDRRVLWNKTERLIFGLQKLMILNQGQLERFLCHGQVRWDFDGL